MGAQCDPKKFPLFDLDCPDAILWAFFSALPNRELLACDGLNSKTHRVAAQVWKVRAREYGPCPAWCLPKFWCLSSGKVSISSAQGLTAAIASQFGGKNYLYLRKEGTQAVWRLWKSVDDEGVLSVVAQSGSSVYGYQIAKKKDHLFECFCGGLTSFAVEQKRSSFLKLSGQGAGRCQLLLLLQYGRVVEPFVPTYPSIAYCEVTAFFENTKCPLPSDVKTRNPMIWIGIALVGVVAAQRLAVRYVPDWVERMEKIVAYSLGVEGQY